MADNAVINISAAEVKGLLCMKKLIHAVEQSLANFSNTVDGGVVQPVRSVLCVDKPDGSDCKGYVSLDIFL